MTDRPALMSAPMVSALLREIEVAGAGKTQTRRPAWQSYRTQKLQPLSAYATRASIWQSVEPGDRIWVRETFLAVGGLNPDRARIVYRATNDGPDAWISPSWRPSIHMPRWASRLTLVVTAARMERVQEITADDAMAEGIAIEGFPQPITAFFRLWKSLHPKPPHRLEDNPEVVAVTFVPHLCNVDAMAAVHLTWDEESGAELARVKGT